MLSIDHVLASFTLIVGLVYIITASALWSQPASSLTLQAVTTPKDEVWTLPIRFVPFWLTVTGVLYTFSAGWRLTHDRFVECGLGPKQTGLYINGVIWWGILGFIGTLTPGVWDNYNIESGVGQVAWALTVGGVPLLFMYAMMVLLFVCQRR